MSAPETVREWRVVDGAGAPYDEGLELWPIYEDRGHADDALERARDTAPDEGMRLEERVVAPWRTVA